MFTKFETYAKCIKCGALYDDSSTCVPCAIQWATLALTIQETTRSYNCDWLGKEYKNEHLAS